MTLEQAVNKFVDSHAQMFISEGAFVDRNHWLIFNKTEHNELFKYGYYVPDYKEWLLENATLKEW